MGKEERSGIDRGWPGRCDMQDDDGVRSAKDGGSLRRREGM